MFKSFTANLGSGKLPVSFRTDPDTPGPVRRAARFMYAGAGVSTISLILTVVTSFGLKGALVASNAQQLKDHKVTMSQISSAATAYIVYSIVIGAVAVGLWIWMAKKNEAGRLWARRTATVFFALWSFYTYMSITSLKGGMTVTAAFIVNFVLMLVMWGVGLAATYLLWRPASTAYFKASGTRVQ